MEYGRKFRVFFRNKNVPSHGPTGGASCRQDPFVDFLLGSHDFLKKRTGPGRGPSYRYPPGLGAMRTARGEERGSPCSVTDVKSTFFQILRRTKKTTARGVFWDV